MENVMRGGRYLSAAEQTAPVEEQTAPVERQSLVEEQPALLDEQLGLVKERPALDGDGRPEFRLTAATGGRVALEVLDAAGVVAVDVATGFGALVLGGLRGRDPGGAWAVAWGRRPADGAAVTVRFDGRLRRGSTVTAQAAGPFWIARADGWFSALSAVAGPGPGLRWRLAGWTGAH